MAKRSRGYVLTDEMTTLIEVAAGQNWIIDFLSITNNGSVAQDVAIWFIDDSDGGSRYPLVPSTPVAAKFMYQPFEGDLALNAGDRLEARGITDMEGDSIKLTIVMTIEDGT